MSDVKAAARTLDLLETYADVKESLSLSELSEKLDVPIASCHRLVRTLTARGYLYETGRRGRQYYPTRRVLDVATEISTHDPVSRYALRALEDLRDQTGETTILARRQDTKVMHLASYESNQHVRYTGRPGDFRPLHASAMGKAILASLAPDERARLLERTGVPKLTRRTHASRASLEREIERSTGRGWFENNEESLDGVYSIAMPVYIQGDCYAIAIVCPAQRKAGMARHLAALRRTCVSIASRSSSSRR